ncbi:D-alanyl-D-alanine carboxypeptidase [Streptomyces sp. NA02536]|uniref:D-alanyl-D-alanine carboxypeptidase n=1 Tax=Streptomyces sp. NA02536 TaxID=2742133 RepID=UPI0015925E24|nr:D-alanyl-D-alanine carboxypeptidase [Streptomyces sp. NA02536]QKW01057.1 D-alanyl-D-alanine carboxypeptidase [Streptomyces sp. NA02536]
MAGESPDRSKQRESSAEPTWGSAGPVPEKRDPRLAVAREAAGPSEKRDRVDTATRVLSTRDGRLREAVASWVRSAEPDETPRTNGTDTGAGTGTGDGPAKPAAAPEGDETPAGTTETCTATSEAPRAPEKPAETARDASTGDGDAEGRTPAVPVRSAADTEATDASEDEPAATAETGTPASNAPRDPETAAKDAPDADTDATDASPRGEDAEDQAPAATARSAADVDATDASEDEKPAATAKTPAQTATDASDHADDAAEPAKSATDADATGASTDAEDAEDEKPAVTAATGTPASEASRDAEKPAEAATDAEGRAAAGTARSAAPASEASRDAGSPAKTAPEGDSDDGSEDEAVAGTADEPASEEPEADAKAASGDDDSEGDEPDGTAKGDEGGSGASAPKSGGGDPDGGGRPKAKGPVDQPTAVFRTGRASAPAVDQPTTMLKLGDVSRREAEAERTSKFVALKRDEDLGGGKPPTAPGGTAGPTGPTTALPQVGPERTTQQPLPPKPPLDLLAELTNTPPPPQTPLRTAVRRVKIWTPLVLLLVIVFAVVQNFRPLPTPTLVLTAEDSYTFEGGKPEIPWPAKGQAALDVDGIGTFGSSGEQKPVPIASVAKVMTAYLILRDHPLKSGADGPMIDVDQTAEKQSSAGDESTVQVTAGDKISQREALEAILIASANNVARLVARWDAGSEKAFVEKMNEAAKDLGMTNTTYTDPSGLNNTTVSTAVDQVKLAKAAMEQPAFREVAAMMEYIDYKGVKHGNWNRLVGHNNVVGIKTGTTTSALGNLSFAAKKDVDGETRRIIGAVVRQPEGGADNTILAGALSAGDQLIRAAQGALESATILKKGTVVGYADDGLGGRTPVAVTEDVKAVGWAGLSVKLTFAGDELPHTAKAGTKVGTLTVGDGSNGAVKVPVALQEDLVEPGFTDKLTRIT